MMCSRPDVLDTLCRPTCDGNTRREDRGGGMYSAIGKLHVVAFIELSMMPSHSMASRDDLWWLLENEAHVGYYGRQLDKPRTCERFAL